MICGRGPRCPRRAPRPAAPVEPVLDVGRGDEGDRRPSDPDGGDRLGEPVEPVGRQARHVDPAVARPCRCRARSRSAATCSGLAPSSENMPRCAATKSKRSELVARRSASASPRRSSSMPQPHRLELGHPVGAQPGVAQDRSRPPSRRGRAGRSSSAGSARRGWTAATSAALGVGGEHEGRADPVAIEPEVLRAARRQHHLGHRARPCAAAPPRPPPARRRSPGRRGRSSAPRRASRRTRVSSRHCAEVEVRAGRVVAAAVQQQHVARLHPGEVGHHAGEVHAAGRRRRSSGSCGPACRDSRGSPGGSARSGPNARPWPPGSRAGSARRAGGSRRCRPGSAPRPAARRATASPSVSVASSPATKSRSPSSPT